MSKNEIFCSDPNRQYKSQKNGINKAVSGVLKSKNYILGENVGAFENEFASYIGARYCIGVNSGTDALILSLRALEIGPGDEVITPSHTAVATIAAIVAVGAKPIFLDILESNFTVDIDKAHKLITKKTKAIIVVHIYGQPCKMDEISTFVKLHQLWLIEDCAQSTGAEFKGRKVGTFGDLSCFSFYPTKNLGAIGDGGAVLTNNYRLYRKIQNDRQYGWDSKKNIKKFGIISRLDELQAAILRVKLKQLDDDNRKRIILANQYFYKLKSLNIFLPNHSVHELHVYHLFVIRTKKRDVLINNLAELGIQLGIHYKKPGHKYFSEVERGKKTYKDLSVTNRVSKEIVSLPIYPQLTFRTVNYICDQIIKSMSHEK